jgi:hypothetical protein
MVSTSSAPTPVLGYNTVLADVFTRLRLTYGDLPGLARRWDIPLDVLSEWFTVTPLDWAARNVKALHRAGLTPEQGNALYDLLDPSVRTQVGRLLDVARMANLDMAYLDRWVRSGLIKERRTPAKKPRRPDKVEFTPWVTDARRFIAATGGDENLASLAAAAGLNAEETALQFAANTLAEETLRAMVALREGNRLVEYYQRR